MSKTNKQLVPKIRFVGFSGNWTKDYLVELTDKIGDGIHATPIYSEEGEVPFINGNNLVNNVITITENTKKISYTELEKYNQYLNSRSLLMSINGTIGNTAFYNNETVLLGKSICYINVNDILNLNYCFYYLSSPKIVKDIEVSLTGSTIKNLSLKTIRSLEVNFPGFSEQTQIGNFFQQIDKLIELQTRAVESAETYKKAMLQKMFPQKGEKAPRVRFEGFSGDWKNVALGNLVDKSIKWSFIGGPFGSNLKAEDYTTEGVRVIQLQNMGDGEFIDNHHIFVSSEKADDLLSCNIYPNEILIAKMGDPVARCCIVPETHDRYLMCSDGIRVVVDSSKYSSLFIYQSINLTDFREKAIAAGTGSTRKRINLSDLKKLELSAPSLEEQTQIGNFFQKLDQNIESEKKKLEQYQTMKRAMLQRMFM